MKLNLVRNNTFDNQIVIVDGQGRSGKNLISISLTAIKKMEKMRLDSFMDYIPRLYYLKKLSPDAAVVCLKLLADQAYYYSSISRDVNFRPADYSSVTKQAFKFKYIKRLFQNADEDAVQRLKIEKPILQEMTHDAIGMADIFFEAFGDRLKFIHVLRDPVGNIFEQNKRGFGERYGVDPRELQLSFEYKNLDIPIQAIDYEQLWIDGSPLEKLLINVNAMYRKNYKGYASLDKKYKDKVLLVDFDKFILDPYPYLSDIEIFLEENFTRKIKGILRRENCPRVIAESQRQERISSILEKIRTNYQEIFLKLIDDYDKNEWS